LVTEKAARLDRDTFGVDGAHAHGPWQQRLAEIGGIKPLAFGQFGEMGPGLEALLASVAKRGADEMADRYLIENREAAVGVQVFHLRQRWGAAAIWRAQTQVLIGRLKCALPGWEETESRRAADTAAEASCRSHASGSGPRGFDAGSWGWGAGYARRRPTWIAPTGTPATRALECGGCCTSCGCVDTRVRAERARAGSVFFFLGGGALPGP
jgi:hypothetical protein